MAPYLARAAYAARGTFPRFARSGAALEREFPDEPVWYLQALGVHPNAQRQGVGAALLAAGLEVVDANRPACHLHTSDHTNVVYYRRWGFELTQLGFHAGPGGPTYYGMTRAAR
jgi:GNAT superfamily N-acetyltransferase